MKDIPVFATQFGVASLTLKQIPYNACAYITLHDSVQPDALLHECISFCQAAGASAVFASGHAIVEQYPFHTCVLLMRCSRLQLPETTAVAHPLKQEQLEQFREIYNDAMRSIDNAAYMSLADGKKILSDGKGYLIYRDNILIGIGIVGGTQIDMLASIVPGSGKDVLLALNQVLSGEFVQVEVASSNSKAMRLYEKIGFEKCEELSHWFRIV